MTRQQWQLWRSQGLFLFSLPPYYCEMNRIEDQWHQLKTHEIAGRMFEDEYNLALAIIDGMEAQSAIAIERKTGQRLLKGRALSIGEVQALFHVCAQDESVKSSCSDP